MLELNQGIQLADRYTLVRRLGGDGGAQIWLANDKLTRASVALKITQGDAESAARLRAEWQTNIRMMHAHVVRVFEFHAEPEVAFYSQQFIDGPDLGVLTGRPVAEVLGPFGLLADALAYVHSKGIVHRDLKSSNVLLDGNGAPYLTDFGVSRKEGETAAGGSPIAQSPQSQRGDPATSADDIFALGTLLYELLSGRPPWPAEDIGQGIESQQAVALRTVLGPDFPGEISDLVERMLDKDAARRPAASEIVSALTDAGYAPRTATISGAQRKIDDEIIESVATIRPDRKPADPGRATASGESEGLSRKTVGLALGALLLVLVGVVFVLPGNVPEDAEPLTVTPAEVSGESDSQVPVVLGDPKDRRQVYVDPEVRKRIKGTTEAPTLKLTDDDDITFSENQADYSGLDNEGRARLSAETTLGELLSALEVLEGRGIEYWATREHRAARELYTEGDQAYLEKDFLYSEELYLGALTVLEPLYERIEPTFQKALDDAVSAFEAGDRLEALRLYELAVAITPSNPAAQEGYTRARNLEDVLTFVDQGLAFEKDLELDAAQDSFEKAIELDNEWQPAHDGIARVKKLRTEIEFDTRMSEGFEAIAAGDYLAARAAFRVAQRLDPQSTEPADGLLQVDQGLRLDQIGTLEMEAHALEQDEHWDAVVKTYEEILKVDNTLSFAAEGIARGRQMSQLHNQLEELIAQPDRLSAPSVMQKATMLVVSITTRSEVGPRLAGQRDELSRLLKRAATPLTVPLISDNVTDVAIHKVGRLGNFMRKEVDLRPGTYVAVGSRPGYRDVRLEFRVAPEIDMEPVIVQCEEPI